jgi:hypothetical protein
MSLRKEFSLDSICRGYMAKGRGGKVYVRGNVSRQLRNSTLIYWAANSPDYRTSYSGSGLPFANSDMAYEKTPNRGAVRVGGDGSFDFSIDVPSSYYTALGTVYVKPHLHLQFNSQNRIGKKYSIPVGEGIPFRLLTYPPIPETAPRCSPNFYKGRDTLPIRTQEQIIRDSAYPCQNSMPANFWGLAVPHP